jgi:hypothetical protein
MQLAIHSMYMYFTRVSNMNICREFQFNFYFYTNKIFIVIYLIGD